MGAAAGPAPGADRAEAEHPFVAVAHLAAARGVAALTLHDIEEPRGRYIRLVLQDPPLIFKRRSDQGSNVDRVGYPYHDRIEIDEAMIGRGAEAVLDHILAVAAAR